jgi:phytol kinase
MTSTEFVIVLAMALLFGVVFAGIEIIKRRWKISPEIMRRVAHIASGLLVLLDYVLLSPVLFVALVGGGWFVFFAASKLKLLTAVNDVARRTYGQYVLTAGYLGAFGISQFEPAVFVPSVLIVTFADSFAGLVGTLVRSPRRTMLGSLVFFVIALGLLIATSAAPVLVAIGIAATLTLIERVSPLGLDNVTIPVAAALLLLVL